mgnify:CR=1 FL=1
MTLRIFDTLTLKKKAFRAEGRVVRIFLCGPTVYDYCHLGHARTFVAFDTIARYLRFRGHRTKVVMNVTDISKEIIENAERNGQDPGKYSTKYFQSMLEDLKALEVNTIDEVVRASHNVPEMIGWIEKLLERGAAYITDEGVFLDTSRVKGYGSLSHQSRRELALRRLDLSPAKKNPEDFLLWTYTRSERSAWDSPWGKGCPGQHIEDAAACTKYFGTSYHINGGGDELVFPHHEATKAQVEAVTGRPVCRYWLHTGLLRVRRRKMSKSLRNFITIREALPRYGVHALRLYFSLTHYRKPLDFRHSDLEKAFRLSRSFHNSVEKMKDIVASFSGKERNINLDRVVTRCESRFIEAMDNDFDTESAVKELMDLACYSARGQRLNRHSPTSLSGALRSLTKLSGILGIL